MALKDKAAKRELESLLSGEADANDCYIEVNAGAGGTEAQDWAEMLLRMYCAGPKRTATRRLAGRGAGEEAGIKSATVQIKGHNAYGWLKTEAGVHRLVRISPYDSQARRHTSFAQRGRQPGDRRQDRDRGAGQGSSRRHLPGVRRRRPAHQQDRLAVRITHIPTNIVVQCQQERSQHKNRAKAFDMLRARLYEAELKKREDAAAAPGGDQAGYRLGHQIRSYVLQPYQMVKDLRTGVETSQSGAVLDGDIDEFLGAALARASRVRGTAKPPDSV